MSIKSILQRNFLLNRLIIKYGAYKNIRRVVKKFPGTTFGNGCEVINPEALILGKNVSFQNNIQLHCGGLDWCNFEGGISIGDSSVVSSFCVFWGTGAKIRIGKNFDCAPGVKIFASRTDFEANPRPGNNRPHIFQDVVIGNDVICYADVTISPGVTIGDGAVIGANSLVLEDIPAWSLAAGSPAIVIRKRQLNGNE